MIGNHQPSFSQGLEKTAESFPRLGKFSAKFSNAWKNHLLPFPAELCETGSLGLPILGKLLAVLLLAPLAFAGEFKLPTGVYHLHQLGAAKDEAAKNGKALAFVLSELKGKGSKAAIPNTNYAFDKLKGVAVPVYVDYTDDLKSLPEKHPMVAKALNSNLAGKTIPRVAALSPDCSRVLAVVSTMPMGVMGDGVYEDACKQIQAYLKDPEKSVSLESGEKRKGKKHR